MKLKNLFGGIDLTWKKLIIFAIISGAYTALMALLPQVQSTSLADISISFEVWILFGIIIIMNSKSAKDSALKCFIFFLISQPLVYLLQVPFSSEGWALFGYYKYWFVWTILTIPMGFFGYYMKKDNLRGLLFILTPMLLFLGVHYNQFLKQAIYNFPHHLLTTVFCFATLLIYPLCIFKNKKIRITGLVISIIIISVMTVLSNRIMYSDEVLISSEENEIAFDDTYTVYLENSNIGKVQIQYSYGLQNYLVKAEFKKIGKTNLILQDLNGNKTVFELEVGYNTYKLNKR